MFAIVITSSCAREDKGLAACERVIQDGLAAPSTYQRVSVDGEAATGLGSVKITYDAQNAMGVPIRAAGTCYVVDGKASWHEHPRN